MTEVLPDRRMAQEDRREHPGAGYGQAMSLDPDNHRVVIRRSWKKNRGWPQPPPDTLDELLKSVREAATLVNAALPTAAEAGERFIEEARKFPTAAEAEVSLQRMLCRLRTQNEDTES